MAKRLILLILFSFFTWTPPLLAQEAQITGGPEPSFHNSLPNVRLPLDQWDSKNQYIKENFDSFYTIPLINTPQIQIDIGPAQFQITVPFN